MKTKKYPHADLESKRGLFFQIGLVCALAISLVAFEWSSESTISKPAYTDNNWVDALDLPPITKTEEPKKELPAPKALDELVLAPDNTQIIEEYPVFTSEAGENTSSIYEVPDETPDETDQIFIRVENMPEFPGGETALMRYINSNIKYPVICAEIGIQGRVFISFVVDKTGHVTNVSVLRSPDENLSREAIRVISSLPKWEPGRQRDKPVNVSFVVPVNFVLQ